VGKQCPMIFTRLPISTMREVCQVVEQVGVRAREKCERTFLRANTDSRPVDAYVSVNCCTNISGRQPAYGEAIADKHVFEADKHVGPDGLKKPGQPTNHFPNSRLLATSEKIVPSHRIRRRVVDAGGLEGMACNKLRPPRKQVIKQLQIGGFCVEAP